MSLIFVLRVYLKYSIFNVYEHNFIGRIKKRFIDYIFIKEYTHLNKLWNISCVFNVSVLCILLIVFLWFFFLNVLNINKNLNAKKIWANVTLLINIYFKKGIARIKQARILAAIFTPRIYNKWDERKTFVQSLQENFS